MLDPRVFDLYHTQIHPHKYTLVAPPALPAPPVYLTWQHTPAHSEHTPSSLLLPVYTTEARASMLFEVHVDVQSAGEAEAWQLAAPALFVG